MQQDADADDGAVEWAQTYGRPDYFGEVATQIGLSPGGDLVYASGFSAGVDAATLALNAADGTLAWTARYKTRPYENNTWTSGLVVAAGGAVYVSAGSMGDTACKLGPECNFADFVTLGYLPLSTLKEAPQ